MLSKEKVEAVLFKMGMPANVKGFGYIVDSVLLLEEDSKLYSYENELCSDQKLSHSSEGKKKRQYFSSSHNMERLYFYGKTCKNEYQ